MRSLNRDAHSEYVDPASRFIMSAALLLCLASDRPAEAEDPALRLDATIALPGVKGRMDHLALDASGSRLWIAALGNDSVEVADLQTATRIQSLKGPREPQGVCAVPELKTLIIAGGGDGMVRAYDERFQIVASVSGLDDADNVRYERDEKRVYVGYGRGALAVLNAQDLARLGDIRLDGHPESFQLEARGNRIFVNVPDARKVAVIDRDQRAVVASWPIREASGNFAMALNEADRRLFIVCRNPARMLVMDADSGKVKANLECCHDADDIFLDAARRRVYITGGAGSISVFAWSDPDTFKPVPAVATRAGARTSLFDPESGRLFVALPQHDHADAEIRVYQSMP